MTDNSRRLEDEERWSELMKRSQLGDSAANERAAADVETRQEMTDPTRLVDGMVALEALPEAQRQVILLAKYGGLTAAPGNALSGGF